MPFVVCKIFGNVTCPVWVPLWPRVLCLLHNSYQYNSGGSEEIVEDTKENSFLFVEISNLYAFPDIHQTRMKLRILLGCQDTAADFPRPLCRQEETKLSWQTEASLRRWIKKKCTFEMGLSTWPNYIEEKAVFKITIIVS